MNVGITTAVEFLQKKGFTVEANPNTKITDEQFEMLKKEFSTDKDLKMKSERFSQVRQNKERNKASVSIDGYETETQEKTKSEEIRTVIPEDIRPKFKQVGKIDLDKLNRRPVVEKEEEVHNTQMEKSTEEKNVETIEKVEEVATNVQAEQETTVTADESDKQVEESQPEPQAQVVSSQPEQTLVQDAAAADSQEDVVSASQQAEPAEEPLQENASASDEADGAEPEAEHTEETKKSGEEEIFKIRQPEFVSKINVIGQIDLAALNQSTRPKKKKMKDINDGDLGGKKKRVRINKEKVDINNASNFQRGGNDRQKGGNPMAGVPGQPGSGKKNKDRFKKPVVKQEVSEEDVAKQVKETLARLTAKGKSKGAKYRKEKREQAADRMHELENQEMADSKVLKLTEFVTANELASMMDVPVTQVIGTCMSIGIMVSINQRLDAETINLVAEEFGFKTEYVSAEVAQAIVEEADAEEDLQPRAPIVTVMGHVDHGKTSLLDYIRKANVIAGEAGGITQHIGAYNVKLEDGRRITFLDTPGHEAFTAMRARGAKVTDVVIIIVAADDNVMPQTKEAINHAMAAGVPIVFAINKIDKPTANPDKIKEELASMNFLVEEWGGKYQSQDISAKKGIGVPELLEKVLLEAEMLDLKANPNRKATGSIIESSLDKGRGYVATVLVSNGTLKVGDIVLAGTNYGKVKAMFNERNQRMKEAGPAEPALILGLNGAPAAGDTFHVIETEQEAREIANKREQLQREQGLRTQKMLTLDEVGRRLALGDFHELNIIVKGDVDGSVEALSDSLIKLSTEQIQVNVIHKGVGQISESDVSLAAASDAIIVGFQVRPSNSAAKLAEQEGVDIRKYSVIYDAIEEVKSAMEGMLAPTVKEQVTATIEVREVFNISKVGMVAGAMVKTGKVKRTDKARLIRDGIVIFSGNINALKRFKDDVKEVGTNFECGISLTNCNDIKVGDIIETYEEVEVKQTL